MYSRGGYKMLTINELEEAKTLLRIAAYDWKNEFENFGKAAIDDKTYEGLTASYYTYQVNGDRVILDSANPKNILKIEIQCKDNLRLFTFTSEKQNWIERLKKWNVQI